MGAWRRTSHSISAPVVLVCGLLSACGGGDSTPDPAGPGTRPLTIQAVTATTQTAVAGSPVPTPPAVRILDPAGPPVAGVPVTFAVGTGFGTLTPPSQTTDGEGLARVKRWTLGPTVGENTLIATIAGEVSVTFTVTGTAGPPATMIKETEDPPPVLVGTPAPSPPTVRIMDALANPVPGIRVVFTTSRPSLPFTQEFVLTDSTGRAGMLSWVMSPFAGRNQVSVDVPGIRGVVFKAIGLPGTPTLMAHTSVTDQSAIVGAKVNTPPTVRVTDQNGNRVPGVAVTFEVTEGGGLVDRAGSIIVETDTAGVAAPGHWRLGEVPGSNTVVARLEPWTESFTATAIQPPAVGQRASQDRPDDISGLQMHVIYVTSRGGPDRGLDLNGALENSVRRFQVWFAGQTGRTVRQDMFEGRLDVSAYQMTLTDAEIAGSNPSNPSVVGTLFQELQAAGFDEPNKKYLVYYDGTSAFACGGALVNGKGAALYLNGRPGCANLPLVTAPDATPGYWDFAGLHDFLHSLGYVDPSAPTANGFHTTDCSCDLMDGGNLGPWRPTLVDFGNDDYYAPSLPTGLPNLRLDPWLVAAPAALMAQASALSSRQAPVLPYHPHDLVSPGR